MPVSLIAYTRMREDMFDRGYRMALKHVKEVVEREGVTVSEAVRSLERHK